MNTCYKDEVCLIAEGLTEDYVRVKARLKELVVWSPAAEKVTKLLAMYHFKLLF